MSPTTAGVLPRSPREEGLNEQVTERGGKAIRVVATATIAAMPDSHSPIKLVCFDLGGVLIRICRSWDEGCRAAGLDVRGAAVADPAGANGRRDLSRLHQSGKMACVEFFQAVSRASGDLYAAHEVERIHNAWLLGEYPGVHAVIDDIRHAGLRTAALSNTNLSHWIALQRYPSISSLDFRLASHELGMVKPDEAIYREAERIFAVKAGHILFFDDLPDNIQAARRVGWDAVQIDHTADPAQQIRSALQSRSLV